MDSEKEIQKFKEDCYELATLKQLGNNPQGTRMDVVYMAMDLFVIHIRKKNQELEDRVAELEKNKLRADRLAFAVVEVLKYYIPAFLITTGRTELTNAVSDYQFPKPIK